MATKSQTDDDFPYERDEDGNLVVGEDGRLVKKEQLGPPDPPADEGS